MKYPQPTITKTEKSTPCSISFLCMGHVVEGRFVPSHAYIQADTLEVQQAVQVYLEERGVSEVRIG